MRHKIIQFILCSVTPMFCATVVLANPQEASKTVTQTQRSMQQSVLAKRLGWVQTGGACNLCDGYYRQPKDLVLHPHPASPKQLPTSITAEGPTIFRQNGQSVLTGGVVVTQPGRRITADRALVLRDQKTSKVVALTLMGHVHLQQYGKLVVAPYAHLDLRQKSVLLRDAIYHVGHFINIADKTSKITYDAWGFADFLHNPSRDVLDLKGASYTTCSPLNPVWMLSAKHIHLNRHQGIGKAYSTVLRIKKIPVLYLPYLRFPIDNRRLSGFLTPDFMHSKRLGFSVSTPFYWNMASNYDTTLTPRYMTKRGFEISALSRYLTAGGHGVLDLNFLPKDNAFKHYRQDTIAAYANDPDLTQYVNQLRGYHNDRGFFAFNGHEQWNPQWRTEVHVNYATDPYYFRDLGTPIPLNSPDQLLNALSTQYIGDHWNVTGLLQAYQTLHRIDEAYDPVFNQYQRLPEFDAQALYPSVWRAMDFSVTAQFVNFNYKSDFPTEENTLPTPEGLRWHARPGLSYHVTAASAYLNPQLYLDTTAYGTHFKATDESGTRGDFDRTRVLPIVAIDSGVYFDRRTQFWGHHYIQTLEPRLLYLYVPYQKQADYPNFDTELLPINFAQLFRFNRFTGYDRLENANQISLGLTSRLLSASNADERFRADLGVIVYFQNPKVILPGETLSANTLSPLIGSAEYHINPLWTASGGVAWDFHHDHMNNASADVVYSDHAHHIIDFGYGYVHEVGQTILGLSNSTNEVHAGFLLPVHSRWSVLGYAAYDIAQKRADTYYSGLQYDSCCWALRFIYDRHFIGQSPSSTPSHIQNTYDNVYYLQLLLKGLGSVGNSNPSSLLRSSLSGYRDPFQMHY